MKFPLFLIMLLFLIPSIVKSQDTLITVNGEIIRGKVTEIGLKNIEFTMPSGLNASLPYKEVFMIKYENGTRDVFSEHLSAEVETKGKLTSGELYLKGKADADKYYSGSDAFCLGGVTSACYPAPLLVILAYSTANPKPKPTVVSDTLVKNPDYIRGYKDQYRLKGTKKAALGGLAGAGAILAAYIAIIAISIAGM